MCFILLQIQHTLRNMKIQQVLHSAIKPMGSNYSLKCGWDVLYKPHILLHILLYLRTTYQSQCLDQEWRLEWHSSLKWTLSEWEHSASVLVG